MVFLFKERENFQTDKLVISYAFIKWNCQHSRLLDCVLFPNETSQAVIHQTFLSRGKCKHEVMPTFAWDNFRIALY